MPTYEDHMRQFHGYLDTPVSQQAVQGVVVLPSDVTVTTARASELHAAIVAVRDRMVAAHGLTFDVPPIRTIRSANPIEWFSHSVSFHGRTADLLMPCAVPTIGWVQGVPHDWAGSGGYSKWASIGNVAERNFKNVIMHELGHIYTGMLGHLKNPPREVPSWFGFGPTQKLFDIMSVFQQDAYGTGREEIAAYWEPLDHVEFGPGSVPMVSRHENLRKV